MVFLVLKSVRAEYAELLRLAQKLEPVLEFFCVSAGNYLVEIDLSVICFLTCGRFAVVH